MNKYFIVLAITSLLTLKVAIAENQQGSGLLENQEGTGLAFHISVDNNQRIIFNANADTLQALGSGFTQQHYAEIIVDAISNQQITPSWGKAEVLLGCGIADVILYQAVGAEWVEVAVTQVVIDYCQP